MNIKILKTLCATTSTVLLLTAVRPLNAEDAAPAPASVSAGIDVTAANAYVWRGQVLNDKPVLQPSLTVSKAGFSLNVWNNFNLTDRVTPERGQFSETDLTASYSRDVGPVTLGGGIIEYLFPNTAFSSTRELFVSAGLSKIPLAPSVTVYRDIDEARGFYSTITVGQSFDIIADKLSVAGSFCNGFGDSDYNSYYFGVDSAKPNDGNVCASATIKMPCSLTLTPAVQYTWLWNSEIRDAADALYFKKDAVVGSVKLSYVF